MAEVSQSPVLNTPMLCHLTCPSPAMEESIFTKYHYIPGILSSKLLKHWASLFSTVTFRALPSEPTEIGTISIINAEVYF